MFRSLTILTTPHAVMQCRFDSFSLPNPGTSKDSVLGTKSYRSDAGWTAADIQMLHLRTLHTKVVNHDIQKSTYNISQRCYQKEWVWMLMILNKPPKRCNTCRTNPSSQPLLPKRAPPPVPSKNQIKLTAPNAEALVSVFLPEAQPKKTQTRPRSNDAYCCDEYRCLDDPPPPYPVL